MVIAASDFQYIANLVYEQSAVVLTENKDYLVQARLARLVRDENLADIAALVKRLRTDAGRRLVDAVVDAMTTNESSFFRDFHPFEDFREIILPAVIKQRSSEKTLNIWCGACATGQEPYSVAMMLCSAFPALRNWKVRLIASDISESMLAFAKAGQYSQLEINRGLPANMLEQYFEKSGSKWSITSELRSKIEFRKINLARPLTGLPPLDVIFLRNVLIYFDRERKRDIMAQLARVLRQDGFLILGAAESTDNIGGEFISYKAPHSRYFQLRK